TMRPSQEFRFWARRAPTGERVAAGVASLVVLALVAWLLLPGSERAATNLAASGGTSGASGGEASGANAAGPAAGNQGAAAATPGSAPGGGGGVAGGSAAHAAAPGAGGGSGPVGPGCPPLAAGTKGVTATQIRIAVMIVDIAGPAADSTFGIAAPDQQRADYNAILDSINKAGGIACRQVVAQYYNV